MASSSKRRRRSADQGCTIFWRDIPAQVTITSAGTKGAWLLDPRFQVAIDRAAMLAGLSDADDYVLQWRREQFAVQHTDDPESAAMVAALAVESEYPPERLEKLVANGGAEECSLDEIPLGMEKGS